jgi:N-acetylglucosamine-6-phosphate deacetylase
MTSTIAARRLISGDSVVEYPLITVESGRIGTIDYERKDATHRFDDATLVPAYVDIHIHGCAGHDVMEATPDALRTIGSYLATVGSKRISRRRSLLPGKRR